MAAGTGGGGGAIRAGQAFVELLGRDAGLGQALSKAASRLQSFGAQVAKVGLGLAGGGAAVLAPITGLFAAAVDQGTTLDNLARQLGTTVESVSALAFAFESSGLKMEEFGDLAKTLDQKLSQAMDGKDEAAEGFRRLGLNAAELAKMPLPDRLGAVGEALSKVALASDRTEFAMKLLGGQGQKALRLLGSGAEGIRARMQEAGEAGAVVTSEQAAQARQIDLAWLKMSSAVKSAFLEVGRAILPQADTIDDVAAHILGAARGVRQFIKDNQGLILGVAAAAAGAVAAGTALAAFGLAVQGAVAAVIVLKTVGAATGALLSAAFGVATAAVGALFTPLGAAAAVLGTLGYLFVTQTDKGKAAMGALGGAAGSAFDAVRDEAKSAFATVKDAAVQAWGGISAAIKAGDLAGAASIALAALEVVFRQAVASLAPIWDGARDYVIDAWQTASTKTAEIMDGFTAPFRVALGMIAEELEEWKQIWSELGPFFETTWQALVAPAVMAFEAISAIATKAFDAITSVVGDFKEYFIGAAFFLAGPFIQAATLIAKFWDKIVEGMKAVFTGMLDRVLVNAIALAQTIGSKTLVEKLLRLRRGDEKPSDVPDAVAAADEAAKKARDDALAEAKDARKAAKEAMAEVRKDAVDGAKAGLEEAVRAAEAARAFKAAEEEAAKPEKMAELMDHVAKKQETALKAARSARGAFQAANFAGLLGAGDSVAQRQVTLAETANDKLDKIEAAIKKLKGPIFG